MRRAVIFDAYPHVYGGAQRSAHLLARGLPARGWRLDVVTTGTGVLTERLRADGIEPHVVPVPEALRGYGRRITGARRPRAAAALPAYWYRLRRALEEHDPAVVHVASHRGLVLAGLPARSIAPLVWHVGARDPSRALNRGGAALAAAVVVPADGTTRVMPDLARCARLVTAASPIPDKVRRPAPVPLTDEPVIVTTGRLHPDKGFDVAIDALAIVRRSVPDARLVVVGGPQDGYEGLTDQLTARARHHGIADAVSFAGFHPDPHEVVAGARVYLQAARERTEVLPLAIVEAMATGVPVVATHVGAVGDVVRPGETGHLVPPEAPTALARALVGVLGDRDEAERLRRAAFDLVAPPARTEDAFVGAVADLYDDIGAA